jgi:hypothetical protein
MHRPSSRPLAAACLANGLACVLAFGPLAVRSVSAADETSPPLLIRSPMPEGRHQFPPPDRTGRHGSDSPRATGGWWMGTAGVVVALSLFGAISMASRRLLPGRGPGPFEVLARASLSPKHTVHLLRAGDRMLIVGTGPQGPPAILGEWTGPFDNNRPIPAHQRATATGRTSPASDEPIGAES